jgi:hypothetical protein
VKSGTKVSIIRELSNKSDTESFYQNNSSEKATDLEVGFAKDERGLKSTLCTTSFSGLASSLPLHHITKYSHTFLQLRRQRQLSLAHNLDFVGNTTTTATTMDAQTIEDVYMSWHVIQRRTPDYEIAFASVLDEQ